MISIPLLPIFMVAVISFSKFGYSQSDAETNTQKQAPPKQKIENSKSLASPSTPKKETAVQTKEEADVNDIGDTKIVEQSRTNIDFSESLIEGKMNAPSGFLIQGRLSQDLTRMVRLRTSFKPEMLKSTGIPEKNP
ncbi:MAG: hypothetical protein WCI18_04490 [Pseudomonadota bacterium]